nr:hypothetical protein [Bacilli bacterium]
MVVDKYYPEIVVSTKDISIYNIKNYEYIPEVINKILIKLKDKYLSSQNCSKPIINIATGMKIEVWKSSVLETFSNAKYYRVLSLQHKKAKIATMKYLAKMIKYGKVRSKPANNNHNSNSPAIYYYLKNPIIIDGVNYIVNIDIRKVPNENGRFYIHSLQTKKLEQLETYKIAN